MIRNKTLIGCILALAIVAMQAVSAGAAPANQAGTITGTINSVTTTKDSSGNTIVVVTLTDSSGATQTVDLSVSNAVSLGLVTQNPDGSVTVNNVVGQAITIDASLVHANPCSLPAGANQPVSEGLTSFFCGSLGVDYQTVQDLHAQGFGFGVIAQAAFMAQALGGDSTLLAAILNAKKTGDYSMLTLPDGSTPTNWGQLRKDVFSSEVKSMTNLGAIMSGRATPLGSSNTTDTTTTSSTSTNTNASGVGHGHAGDHGGGHGQGKGHGKGH